MSQDTEYNILFSIVIPVYNIENYIEHCIKSALDQKFHNYELILIDDGSTDNSGNICDHYAQMNHHIKVIHTKNRGLSAARNEGINNAMGDFIIFLDGDDYWCKNIMLTELAVYIKQTNADIVAFSGQSMFEDGNNICINDKDMNILIISERCYSSEEFIRVHIQKNPHYEWYACLYAFKRTLFENNYLYFPKGYKYEDVYLIWRLLLKANKIGVLSHKYYVYRRTRTGAITNLHTYQSLMDFLWVLEDNIKTVTGMDNISPDIKKLLADNFSKLYFSLCINANFLKREEKRKYIQELQVKKYIMNYAISIKYVCIAKVAKIIGIHGITCVFDLRRRLKGLVHGYLHQREFILDNKFYFHDKTSTK